MISNNPCSMQIFKEALQRQAKNLQLNSNDIEGLTENYSPFIDVRQESRVQHGSTDKQLATEELYKESSLSVGNFEPSESWCKDKSIGLTLNGEPIMAFGYSNDGKSSQIIDKLLNNPDFIGLIEYFYGDASTLRKEVIDNQSTVDKLNLKSLPTVVESRQGVIEEGDVQGLIEAVIFKDDFAIPYAMSVMNSIMLDIKPESEPLSHCLRLTNKVA